MAGYVADVLTDFDRAVADIVALADSLRAVKGHPDFTPATRESLRKGYEALSGILQENESADASEAWLRLDKLMKSEVLAK